MATSERPKARQSQLVSTYGIGSLFPAGDQSYMICGLDDWHTSEQLQVEEPRLARSLGVSGFYAPSAGRRTGDIPAVRFPTYHYCPQCRTLAPFWKFDSKRMVCQGCERDITPSRFVACCEDGHIEDFPYFGWVHRGSSFEWHAHVSPRLSWCFLLALRYRHWLLVRCEVVYARRRLFTPRVAADQVLRRQTALATRLS